MGKRDPQKPKQSNQTGWGDDNENLRFVKSMWRAMAANTTTRAERITASYVDNSRCYTRATLMHAARQEANSFPRGTAGSDLCQPWWLWW